jgi:hypothetical protein
MSRFISPRKAVFYKKETYEWNHILIALVSSLKVFHHNASFGLLRGKPGIAADTLLRPPPRLKKKKKGMNNCRVSFHCF